MTTARRRACQLPLLTACQLALLTACVVGFSTGASADQTLRMRPGWNLVSFAVMPEDPAPSAVLAPLIDAQSFEALWTYDAASDTWSRFPAAAPGEPTITAVEPGRGYWLASPLGGTLVIPEADGALAPGPDQIAEEWNLVGFPLRQPTAYERVLTNAAIRQIWTFDAAQGVFLGVVIDDEGLPVREDFVNLEPGRGYWLRSNAATSLAPELFTSLPSDVDVPPLLPTASVDRSVPWTNKSSGDIDVAEDGTYDRTLTQRGLDFQDRIYQHQLSVGNTGSGVLSWQVAVGRELDPISRLPLPGSDDTDGCPWLRILETDPESGDTTRVTRLEGSVTGERARVQLIALREGLGIARYACELLVRSNGSGPDDAERLITTFMQVGGLEGDYQLRVVLDTVNGKPADLADPRIVLSLYEDEGGLKAIVDPRRTLLVSPGLRLAGRLTESGTTRFSVSGSLELPAGDPGNPFSEPVRRDITLRAERQDRSAADGAIIGSRDLEGEYFETIRNVTAEPVFLVGRFTGERLGARPSARDLVQLENDDGGLVPDGVGVIERTVTVDDPILIDEVDVSVNLDHVRPADLVVTLIGPDGTEVILRELSAAPLFNQIFDEFAAPLGNLGDFDGKIAQGDWTLRVEDRAAGLAGSLLDWSLDIRGTQVHDVAGTAPPDTLVVLTGCGRTELTTSDATGAFSFSGLIDCVYRLEVVDPSFGSGQQVRPVAGGDVTGVVLAPSARVPPTPRPVGLPASPQAVFVSVTSFAGAAATARDGNLQQYALDSASFDIDRPPFVDPANPGSVPGPEDTDAFTGQLDPETRSNRDDGPNFSIDPPVGVASGRITVNLGQPVIGRSVQGDLRLSVGANP